jgi:prepilin-type N-terminal cleavage/methylation domain-containing protein
MRQAQNNRLNKGVSIANSEFRIANAAGNPTVAPFPFEILQGTERMRQKLFVVASGVFLNGAANFGLPNFWTRSRVRNMNPRVSNQKTAAMTLLEVLVVIVVLAVLAAAFLFGDDQSRVNAKVWRINCVNNLKQVGLACKMWEVDHNGKFPMQVSVTNGGTMELTADGKNAWLNFLVMSNELYTPKVLWCVADRDRITATNWTSGFSAATISYFVGLEADTNHPQMFLSGDDNFAIGGVPAKSGLLNLPANAPVTWTSVRHEELDKPNLWTPTRHSYWGNIGLADGSVASVSNLGLTNLLSQTGVATNRLAIP